MEQTIKRALISVFDKDGLSEILSELNRIGVEFISTGGTKAFIESKGYTCIAVEELTQYPEMLGGRVKTLHPAVFGGILARRDVPKDIDTMNELSLPMIDLVIVDLYPFEKTLASGASHDDIIEKIDIGGISLIRAAAKNYQDVVIVPSKAQYPILLELLKRKNGSTSLSERKLFAREAFAVSSHYDAAIYSYFDDDHLAHFRVSLDTPHFLRYGENPHQRGVFYGDLEASFEKLHGKELSYNNMQDVDAAVSLIQEFEAPTFAILKHMNACGVATRETIKDAWIAALEADPVSAFGGVLVANRPIDKETAEEINQIFFEVLIAPDYDTEALACLTEKKNRILLLQKETKIGAQWTFKTALGGVLMQEADNVIEEEKEWDVVTKIAPTIKETSDLIFALKTVKHAKSNAITLVKDNRLLAAGVGQTSRVDALKHAIEKAKSFGFDLQGAVMGSDAFFPFPDCVEIAAAAGIRAIAQPGGSIKDNLSVEAADRLDVAMIFTGKRHFKH